MSIVQYYANRRMEMYVQYLHLPTDVDTTATYFNPLAALRVSDRNVIAVLSSIARARVPDCDEWVWSWTSRCFIPTFGFHGPLLR